MKYICDSYALNLPCELKTTGDWHPVDFEEAKSHLRDSEESIFKEYGIEKFNKDGQLYYKANHIRAILDMLENGKINYLIGFKNDFIVVDDYDFEIMEKVWLLRENKYWPEIDKLMGKEFLFKWKKFKLSYYTKIENHYRKIIFTFLRSNQISDLLFIVKNYLIYNYVIDDNLMDLIRSIFTFNSWEFFQFIINSQKHLYTDINVDKLLENTEKIYKLFNRGC